MENGIKVGEYVRTTIGIIDKVDALYGMIENTVHLENQKWFDTRNIVKHSPNIIDLIEVGDYVNGEQITDIWNGNRISSVKSNFNEDDIKTVVTKEQFESISYKVKKKD